MGTSYGARALVGVCLTRGQIFKKETVRAFDHRVPVGSKHKFDPETGKPLWTEVERCVLIPDGEDEDTSCVQARNYLGGLYLFHDSSGWREDRTRYLLGALAVEDDEYSKMGDNYVPIDGERVENARQRVRAVLEPHGLWPHVEFGLWIVRYVSC